VGTKGRTIQRRLKTNKKLFSKSQDSCVLRKLWEMNEKEFSVMTVKGEKKESYMILPRIQLSPLNSKLKRNFIKQRA